MSSKNALENFSWSDPVTEVDHRVDHCGVNHSFDETVLNYKKYCDGVLLSIIGCLGILGERYFLKNLHLPVKSMKNYYVQFQEICFQFMFCQSPSSETAFTRC